MCGIAGVLYADSLKPVPSGVLKAMGQAIAHRGPDGEGFLSEPGLGLVHRRLSIIDIDGGAQPLGNEDGSIQVVFNGELYNFQGLRRRLESRGHTFRTHSDTEVLVHLYEENGPGLIEHLRGMFAFALWDKPNRRLLLARDRLGIKPLYVYRDSDKLVFGSELKAILAHPGVERSVDPEALEDYLALGMVPGRRAIFRRVEKLPPAHLLVVRADDLQAGPRRYWQLHLDPDSKPRFEEWQEAVRAKLAESVKLHLIADVPVGAFLSGGVDSSAVVGLAAGAASRPLQTFTIGFREESFSELPYAREVSRRFATRHTEQVVTADAIGLLDSLTHSYDEPFADASALPTFLVAQLAARSVKVVLSGDGGDEAFGGYSRYAHDLKEASVRGLLPAWLRRFVLAPLGRVWPKADWLPRCLRAKTLLTNLSLDGPAAYANTMMLCRPPLRRRLLNRDLAAGLNRHSPGLALETAYTTAPAGDPLAGMLAADINNTLPDDFLVKVDRASMAHGLEVRPPFLDHELMELAAQIPSAWKVCGGKTKWLLKESYRGLLPDPLIDRPKQGFEIPIDAWMRRPLRQSFESAVLDPAARVGELVDQPAARALYRSHVSCLARHGNVLWSLLILARWAERYLTPGPPTLPESPLPLARDRLETCQVAGPGAKGMCLLPTSIENP
jgi:asparagine synthase (glutamine-hydrolysing)